jgi:hypothetical protein
MRKLMYAVLVVGLINIAVKLAIVAGLLAGLTFRTKETVALLAILALVSAFNAYPGIGLALIATLILVRLAKPA